ncbi:MAG: nicotinate-nucleotide adenylyltransferase [Kiritimatiellia bacterium]
MKPRIGIFGGTFNPVHTGHLIMAQDALEVFDLARVLFVPCYLPPHKDASRVASAAHRAAMLGKAIEDNPGFEMCDAEIRTGGTNYSIDTIRRLRGLHPGAELFFIIGSDSRMELHQWKEIGTLLKLCRFVTFIRPGFDPGHSAPKALKLAPGARRKLMQGVVTLHQVNISSTDIRHRIAEGLSIRYLVPAAVEMYIAEHNLYKT